MGERGFYARPRFPAAVCLARVSVTASADVASTSGISQKNESHPGGSTAPEGTLDVSVCCVGGRPDMPPAMLTGLHTRPVTPTPQTAVSVCEAPFKRADVSAFQLSAKVRSGIRLNMNNKHQAGLRLLPHLLECARVHVRLIGCVFLCLADVFSLISPDIITPCLCGETAWLLLGNRVRRRPRRSLPKHERARRLCPPIRARGRLCARAVKTHTPSYPP